MKFSLRLTAARSQYAAEGFVHMKHIRTAVVGASGANSALRAFVLVYRSMILISCEFSSLSVVTVCARAQESHCSAGSGFTCVGGGRRMW